MRLKILEERFLCTCSPCRYIASKQPNAKIHFMHSISDYILTSFTANKTGCQTKHYRSQNKLSKISLD